MANEQPKQKKEKKYFFRDFKAELKKVIWPTPKQLVNNTVAVVTIVLIVAAIVAVLDFTFDKMNYYGIDNIKKIVQKNSENIIEGSEEDTENVVDSDNENVVDENTSNDTNETELTTPEE